MKFVSSLLSIISFLMVINVAWLHSAARLGLQAGAPEWMKFVWGLSVPYFFVTAMLWQAKREFKTGARCLTLRASFDILGWEILRLVKRLLVPYFCWCWLGAVWSIALHGVQLKGWEALRYLGLQPGWDPAYQPMWFLRALFGVLVVETIILNVVRVEAADSRSLSIGWCERLRHLVFPVYVLHSMFISAMYAVGVNTPTIVYALVAVASSVVTAIFVRRFLPQISIVLFGGR